MRKGKGGTYVSVRTRSCSSCRFMAISSPHGRRSMCTIGFDDAAPVRITRWKYDGGNASVGMYFGRSPIGVYV